MLTLCPITITEAKAVVAKWHRHNKPPVSGLFAVGVQNGKLCGVAVVGRPNARELQDGATCEITRVATDGTYNACSMLYGACRRAAMALGYRRVYTYTLKSESGASLRAAGFVKDAELEPRPSWSCPSRPDGHLRPGAAAGRGQGAMGLGLRPPQRSRRARKEQP